MNMRNVILPLSFVAGTGAAMIVGGCGSSATHEGNWFTVQTLQDTVVLSTFGGNIESLPRSTSITAQWLNDSAGASGNVRVFGPVFTSFRGLYSQNDARLPAFWRVQANSGPCSGQYIMTATPVNVGDFVVAWCKAQMQASIQSIEVSGETFNSNGDVVAQQCCNTDTLYGNPDVMHMSDYITSDNGRFVFAYSGDGYLNIYQVSTGYTLWYSSAKTTGGALHMQGDGNLVLYSSGGSPKWSSGTAGNPGAYLLMQNDGNLVIYNAMGNPLWATNTCCH